MLEESRILNPDTIKITGDDVRRSNTHAVRLIRSMIESTFGPLGMEKIYLDIIGEATYTKDGATFLRKIDVQHPAAKVLIDATNTVDNEVGDGTLSTAILAASLLEKAEEMINLGINPATIVDGYVDGLEYSKRILNDISKKVNCNDRLIIENLVRVCLGTKLIFPLENHGEMKDIVDATINAIITVYSNNQNSLCVDDIKIEQKIGNMMESKFVEGIILDKTLDDKLSPKYVANANILLLDEDLSSRITKTDAQLSINSPNQLLLFKTMERNIVEEKIMNMIEAGVNVVICRKGIDTRAQELLAKAGIISIKRTKENDLLWLEKSTGGKIIRDANVENIASNLGHAKMVYEEKIGDDKMVFIAPCKNPGAVTLLIRANSKLLLDEFHRAIKSAIILIDRFMKDSSIIIGGGSTEIRQAQYIRNKAMRTEGAKQVVLFKFAEALEEIPLTLAKNCGLNVIDAKIKIGIELSRRKTSRISKFIGVDSENKKIGWLDWNIIEPRILKEQILNSAVEVSRLLINIDNVVVKKLIMNTHTHEDGTEHSHVGGDKNHDHYFDKLGKQQRPSHHYY